MSKRTDYNELGGTAMIAAYNAMIAEATEIGLEGYHPVSKFTDKPTAVRRCEALESSIRAFRAGVAEADQQEKVGRSSHKEKRDKINMNGQTTHAQEPEQAHVPEHNPGVTTSEPPKGLVAEKPAKAAKAAKAAKPPKEPKPAKVAKPPKEVKAKKEVVESGPSKTDQIKVLLTREGGCTSKEVLELTGWPSVSMPAMAKACGLELRKYKAEGKPLQYFGENPSD